MRKLFIIVGMLVAFAVPLMAVAPSVSAVDVVGGACANSNATTTPDFCKDKQGSNGTNPLFGPGGILTIAARIMSIIIGISSVVIIVISGMRMILAGGDANTASNARRGIVYACAALIVALMAQAIVVLVLNKL